MRVEFSDPKRSLAENAMFHGICTALSKSNVEWAGSPRDAKEWKLLLVSGHTVATSGETVEIVNGLEGELVSLRESTAQMSKRRCASLIEYALAFCASNGVSCELEFDRLKRAGLLPEGE